MAAPVIQDADTKNGTQTSDSTSWTLTYPTNIQRGDLILVLLAIDGNPSQSLSGSGWVYGSLISGGVVTISCIKKIADGTESGNFTLTLGAAEQGAWRVFRITGWGGNLGQAFNNNAGSLTGGGHVVMGTSSNTGSSLVFFSSDPANWGTEDTLFILAVSADASPNVSSYPANMPDENTADVSGGAGGATLAVAAKGASAVSSFTPNNMTLSASATWAAAVIMIKPLHNPVVQELDTTTGAVTSNSTSWTLTYPTNIQAGDLLLAFLASDGSQSPVGGTWPAGWVVTGSLSTPVSVVVAKKLATGSETGNFNVTLASEQGAWRIFRITGWLGTLGSDWTSGDVQFAGASGADANPNPPNLDPTWGTEDCLWFGTCAIDASRAITGFPNDMLCWEYSDVSGGSTGATLGVCAANANLASVDPGLFSTTSDDWCSGTIGIRPALPPVAQRRLPVTSLRAVQRAAAR